MSEDAQSIAKEFAEFRQRISAFVLNRLKEVQNDIGGVVGYKLELNAEETETLCKELDN